MAQFTPTAGIDCSKDRLDVHIHPLDLAFSVGNDREGWAELARRLAEEMVMVVGLEASGGCERDVAHFLLEQKYSVRLLDPYRVRQFAKGAVHFFAWRPGTRKGCHYAGRGSPPASCSVVAGLAPARLP